VLVFVCIVMTGWTALGPAVRANQRIIPRECGHLIENNSRNNILNSIKRACCRVYRCNPLSTVFFFSHNRNVTDCFFSSPHRSIGRSDHIYLFMYYGTPILFCLLFIQSSVIFFYRYRLAYLSLD
jgi:hypothetical protein